MSHSLVCERFQLTGRHDLRWEETTETHEVWTCNNEDCGYVERKAVEPQVAT